MDRTNNSSSSNSSLESIHAVLTGVVTQIAAIHEQMDRLAAKVGLDAAISVSTLSDTDAKRQQEIIESGDIEAAYHFAKDVPGADIQALQQVILDHGDELGAYYFARDITGADIQALQQVVLDRGDGWDAYHFARDIPGADIQALQNVVLGRGDDVYAYYFARDIPGADIQALQQVILDHGDELGAYDFAKDVKGSDLVALHKKLAKIGHTYLTSFNNNTDIQDRLKTQLEAAGQSEPEGHTSSTKHKPS